jgi:hypothetical protein
MSTGLIYKERIDERTISLQQSKAVIVGTQVVYVTYESLVGMEQAFLLGEFE